MRFTLLDICKSIGGDWREYANTSSNNWCVNVRKLFNVSFDPTLSYCNACQAAHVLLEDVLVYIKKEKKSEFMYNLIKEKIK